jgi:hypothetical protein
MEEDGFYDIFSITLMIIVILIGVCGNVMNFIVFGQKSMRKLTTFYCLLYLSAIDLLVLCVCSTNALLTYGFEIEIKNYHNWMCRFYSFSKNFLHHMSSVILMFVNIERVIVLSGLKQEKNLLISNIVKPFKTSKNVMIKFKLNINLLDSKRVEKIIAIISITLAVFNIHYLFFSNLNTIHVSHQFNNTMLNNRSFLFIKKYKDIFSYESKINKFKKDNHTFIQENNDTITETIQSCLPIGNKFYYFFYINIWSWIDMMIYSIIPFITMSMCSIIILINIRTKSSSSLRSNRCLMKRRRKRNNQLSILLLSTNLYFLFSSLPFSLDNNKISIDDRDNMKLLRNSILTYSNNSFNFIFYGLFSERYRNTLFQFIQPLKSYFICHTNPTLVLSNFNESRHSIKNYGTLRRNDSKSYDRKKKIRLSINTSLNTFRFIDTKKDSDDRIETSINIIIEPRNSLKIEFMDDLDMISSVT